MAVLKTLAKIGPHADPVFRDECKYQYVQLSQYSFLVSWCFSGESENKPTLFSLSTSDGSSLSPPLVIIARLAEVAVENSKADNLTKKEDIALALLEAYRNISECCILFTWAACDVTWVACDVTWSSVEDRLVQFLVFLDYLPVISTELLTTYMLPGLNSLLRDMETLDADKVVCRKLHFLLHVTACLHSNVSN